jgi:hypothetical protein
LLELRLSFILLFFTMCHTSSDLHSFPIYPTLLYPTLPYYFTLPLPHHSQGELLELQNTLHTSKLQVVRLEAELAAATGREAAERAEKERALKEAADARRDLEAAQKAAGMFGCQFMQKNFSNDEGSIVFCVLI